MNMRQKCNAPVEKHEEACRTSEQRHPFEKRDKTLGTTEAESSPKKEPLENWWPSLSESTPDPGMEYINLGRYSCECSLFLFAAVISFKLNSLYLVRFYAFMSTR